MLIMDEQAMRSLSQLRKELAWLKENFPGKTALIGLAESHIDVIRAAGSCESLSFQVDAKDIYQKAMKGR